MLECRLSPPRRALQTVLPVDPNMRALNMSTACVRTFPPAFYGRPTSDSSGRDTLRAAAPLSGSGAVRCGTAERCNGNGSAIDELGCHTPMASEQTMASTAASAAPAAPAGAPMTKEAMDAKMAGRQAELSKKWAANREEMGVGGHHPNHHHQHRLQHRHATPRQPPPLRAKRLAAATPRHATSRHATPRPTSSLLTLHCRHVTARFETKRNKSLRARPAR